MHCIIYFLLFDHHHHHHHHRQSKEKKDDWKTNSLSLYQILRRKTNPINKFKNHLCIKCYQDVYKWMNQKRYWIKKKTTKTKLSYNKNRELTIIDAVIIIVYPEIQLFVFYLKIFVRTYSFYIHPSWIWWWWWWCWMWNELVWCSTTTTTTKKLFFIYFLTLDISESIFDDPFKTTYDMKIFSVFCFIFFNKFIDIHLGNLNVMMIMIEIFLYSKCTIFYDGLAVWFIFFFCSWL